MEDAKTVISFIPREEVENREKIGRKVKHFLIKKDYNAILTSDSDLITNVELLRE
jgi:hypothetical protein